MSTFEKLLSIPSIKFTSMGINEKTIKLSAKSYNINAKCLVCGKSSHSVHSSYIRNLKDLPVSEYTVNINLIVRKFFCGNKNVKGTYFPNNLLKRL